ncbi:MAG: pilus assembly protein PilM [Chthoniobacterales bacterium]
MRNVADLNAAAGLLNASDEVVLALPVNAIIAQRLRLPTVDPGEFEAMVRLQVEKSFPYPPEEVTSDFEIIERGENESVVSSVAVHNARLDELAGPLLRSGHIPRQVTVYAAQRAASHAAKGRALIIYREGEKLISAISENGKLSFTRTLDAAEEDGLQRDLPQMALSAELQGIDTAFPKVLLDENCLALRDTVERIFAQRPDLMGTEAPPARIKLDLAPETWRKQRAAVVRRKEWRQRLLWAGGIYAALFLLFALYVTIIRFQVGHLRAVTKRDAPKVDFIKSTEANWKALAPAIDPNYYPIEVLLHLFECLPNPDVRITVYEQSARNISVQGEAPSAALAYQFAEKVKKNPGLRSFSFNLQTPRILPNDHAQFRLEGKTK